jgi:serine/threonine-protein kinase
LSHRIGSSLVGLLVLSIGAPASAQPSASSEAAAEALYLEGESLVEKGQFATACPKFADSQRLDPQLGTLLHLADCYERNGQTASAWVTFREAAELAGKKADGRAQVALDRAATLFGKLSFVTVVVPADSQVAGLELERDGQRVLPATWGTPIPVDPGRRLIVARAPGHTPWRTEIDASIPGRTVVTVPLLTEIHEVHETTPPPPAPASTTTPLTTTLGWISLGVGVVSLGVGGAFAAVAGSKSDDADRICPTGRCTRDEISWYRETYDGAKSAATAAGIAIGLGLAFAAGGAVLLSIGRPRGQTGQAARRSNRVVAFVRQGGVSW